MSTDTPVDRPVLVARIGLHDGSIVGDPQLPAPPTNPTDGAIVGDSPEPSTDTAMGPPLGRARQARHTGYIEEFGKGRVCVALGCGVVLSRYNSGLRCSTHEQALRVAM